MVWWMILITYCAFSLSSSLTIFALLFSEKACSGSDPTLEESAMREVHTPPSSKVAHNLSSIIHFATFKTLLLPSSGNQPWYITSGCVFSKKLHEYNALISSLLKHTETAQSRLVLQVHCPLSRCGPPAGCHFQQDWFFSPHLGAPHTPHN